MSAFAYLVKLVRILLAVGLMGTLLLGETRLASAQDGKVELAKKDYEEAQLALKDGRLAEAQAALASALAKVPRFTDAHNLLGVVYSKAERWQDALEQFEKALEVGPAQPNHHYGIAVCKRALGDSKGARASLEKARELTLPDLKENPGQQDVVKGALAEIDYLLAVVARDDGDDKECARCLELALSEDPKNAKPVTARLLAEKGSLLLRTGDAEGAATVLATALEASPDNVPILYNLGRALVASGHETEGKEKLARYEKLDSERREKLNEQRRKDQAQTLAASAQLALGKGNKEEARALAKKAYAFDPTNAAALSVLEATQ